jgi:hypothetical protein
MVSALEQVVDEFKAQFQPTTKDAAPAPVASGAGRGANEGETASPQAAGQSQDNPADDTEPAGAATTPGASEPAE